MNKTTRFFHIRLPNKPAKGGATVRVTSVPTDEGLPPFVRVQVAFCSQEDSFWRAQGRLIAKSHSGINAPASELPKLLAQVHSRVYSMAHVPRRLREIPDYGFATKFFTPKTVNKE
jgi:hypothetical protein